jgi:hypothetical protein
LLVLSCHVLLTATVIFGQDGISKLFDLPLNSSSDDGNNDANDDDDDTNTHALHQNFCSKHGGCQFPFSFDGDEGDGDSSDDNDDDDDEDDDDDDLDNVSKAT